MVWLGPLRSRRDIEREELQRTVSELMDELKDEDPETRDWLDRQLSLLDLEYDPHHWITTEWVR